MSHNTTPDATVDEKGLATRDQTSAGQANADPGIVSGMEVEFLDGGSFTIAAGEYFARVPGSPTDNPNSQTTLIAYAGSTQTPVAIVVFQTELHRFGVYIDVNQTVTLRIAADSEMILPDPAFTATDAYLGFLVASTTSGIVFVQFSPLASLSKANKIADAYQFGGTALMGYAPGSDLISTAGGLTLATAELTLAGRGINAINSEISPNRLVAPATSPQRRLYYTPEGSVGTSAVDIDPDQWWNPMAPALEATPVGRWTTQVINFASDNDGLGLSIGFGQALFGNKQQAIDSLANYLTVFAIPIQTQGVGTEPVAALLVTQGATDLTDSAQAELILLTVPTGDGSRAFDFTPPISALVTQVLGANNAIFPTSNSAGSSSRNKHPILTYDDTTAEDVEWSDVISPDYTGGDITIDIDWVAATATTGGVTWGVEIERLAPGGQDIDSDGFAAQVLGTSTTNAASGIVTRTSIVLTNAAADALAKGDAFRLRLQRVVGNGGDTMVGDAQVLRVFGEQ